MEPTLKDTICDPAMGSAGFIVESAKYITENYKDELVKKENLEHYKTTMFNGFDTDATMLRIGAMNLMLHGVDAPNVKYQDSLSSSNTDENKYTLCLANPPFSGSIDSDDISKSLLAITDTQKTEVLFVSLFTRILQLGGRCASIVPDGILFKKIKGFKNIRKELIEKHRLQAIISMPSGIFEPYSNVSTAILIFTKTGIGGTDKVWFYDMTADGYSLDKKRNEVEENDIPDIIARYKNLKGEEDRTRKDKSFLVSVQEIRDNDYDLSINKYKEIEHVRVKYDAPEVIFKRIEKLQSEINEAMIEFHSKYM